MITVYNDEHAKHAPRREFHRGKFVPAFEKPRRVTMIRTAIRRTKIGPIIAPSDLGLDPVLRVHAPAYLEFLRSLYPRWTEATEGKSRLALPHTWMCRDLRQVRPENLFGQLGYYSFDVDTPIVEGTWRAAYMSAQRLVEGGESAAFALCRPPGHYASRDLYGGYCFLNSAAIAAQAFLDAGASRVTVLDVDYHHGNGTQAIFYERADVQFISLHADPATDYPYFLGYADERGRGEGEGFTVNHPLPQQSGWERYRRELEAALDEVAEFGPDYLVVSLGVDTFVNDPVAEPGFVLRSDDFIDIGRLIRQLGLRTLFVMEGGYAVAALGENVANVLRGFEEL